MHILKVRNVRIQKSWDSKEPVFIRHSQFQPFEKGRLKMRFKFFGDQLALARKLEHLLKMKIPKFSIQMF